MKTTSSNQKTRRTRSDGTVAVIVTLFCVILALILIVNCTLIVKSFTNPDQVPDFFGIVPMIVRTESMEPEIMGGDLIFGTVVDPADIREGDIISFFDPESLKNAVVTHMVHKVETVEGKLYFTTYGINNKLADGSYSIDKAPVPAENLVSRYNGFRVPFGGSIAMFMQSTVGLIVCILIPIFVFALAEILRRRRYEAEHGEDIADLMAELEALKAEKAALEEEVHTAPHPTPAPDVPDEDLTEPEDDLPASEKEELFDPEPLFDDEDELLPEPPAASDAPKQSERSNTEN